MKEAYEKMKEGQVDYLEGRIGRGDYPPSIHMKMVHDPTLKQSLKATLHITTSCEVLPWPVDISDLGKPFISGWMCLSWVYHTLHNICLNISECTVTDRLAYFAAG